MAKQRKEPTDPTTTGPVLAYSATKEVPTAVYTIWIYGNVWQAKDRVKGTKEDIDKVVTQILRDGYTYPVSPKETVVYPAHTINKIAVIQD